MANTLKYTDAVGPAFVDGTTTFTATFNVQSLGASRAYTLPNASGTVALTTGSTFTGGTWHGTVIGVAYGGTGADLSGTGGSNQVVMQTSSGGVFTVSQLALSNLSDGPTHTADSPGIVAPTTGQTQTVSTVLGDFGITVMTPLGTLLAQTFDLADGQYGGQVQALFSSQIITGLTLVGTFSSTSGRAQPTSMLANQCIQWVWDDGAGEWVRFL